jgi:sugar lactone lactonase YvrE
VLGNTGTSPYDVAIDSGGNLYVANYVAGSIQKFGPTGANLGNFITGIFTPDGLAFDSSGNLYVSSYGDGTVLKYSSSGTLLASIGSGLGPQGLTFDSAGNLYVAYSGNGVVKKYNSAGVFVSNFASGLTQPTDLAFDPNGYLYVTDWGSSGKVEIYSPLGADLGPFLSNAPYASGILIVPEPGSVALLLAGSAIGAGRRKRR